MNINGALFARLLCAYGKTYWNRNVQCSRSLLISAQVLVFALLQLLIARLRSRCGSVAIQRARMWHRVRVIVINQLMRCNSIAISALQVTIVRKVNWVGIFHFRVHQRCWRFNDRWWRSSCSAFQVWRNCIWLIGFILQWHVWNGR